MADESSVLKVFKDGLRLNLMDGSRWEIAVGDNTKTILWLPTAPVLIEEESDDQLYPYRITNGSDTVRARKL